MPIDPDAFLAKLGALCAPYPGAEAYIMVHHPAYRVGGKPFVIAGISDRKNEEQTVCFKFAKEEQPIALQDPRFFKTPYIGQHGWTSLRVGEEPDWDEIARLVEHSYRRVAPKKRLAELDAAR